MKTLEYEFRQEEKSKWGEGPWDIEPDKKQWQDKKTGLPCLAVRNPVGAWCGYVGVAEGHPAFGKEYGLVQSGKYADDYSRKIEEAIIPDVEVHGGLTFSNFCVEDGREHGICHVVEPGENDRVWWLGFDCAHMNDYVPGVEATFKELGHKWPDSLEKHPLFGKWYRTLEYVEKECAALAKQLADATDVVGTGER